MKLQSVFCFLLALVFSPLLLGLIHRTKAILAGRCGQPLFQVYYDLWKLSKKDPLYSVTTSWVFRAGPVVGLACSLAALVLVPLGSLPALVSFPGDLFLFAYFLALGRFFTAAVALDTGSSFEGMGASREMQFSVFSEATFFLGLAAVAITAKGLSLSGMLAVMPIKGWAQGGILPLLIGAVFLIVLLAENCRIPVDDPNTHLELTMIHEVMVLDHGGVDLAYIFYAAAIKFWIFAALLIGVLFPWGFKNFWLNIMVFMLEISLVAVLVGVVESSMARLRLIRVPHLLAGAGVMAIIAVGLALGGVR